MNKADLYQKANVVQRRDAKNVIDEFGHLINVKENDLVIDIGTGSGDVLVDFVCPVFDGKNVQITGTDVAQEMLDFARKKYENVQNITFEVLNIEKADINENFCDRFDHVLSFHCINWIQDQK